jgi:hypothetical protein
MEQMNEQLHSISTENNFERIWYLTASPNPLWTQLIHSRYIKRHSLISLFYEIKWKNISIKIPDFEDTYCIAMFCVMS